MRASLNSCLVISCTCLPKDCCWQVRSPEWKFQVNLPCREIRMAVSAKHIDTYIIRELFLALVQLIVTLSIHYACRTDKDNTAIIVGVTVAIALLLFLLGIGLFMRRRRSQGRKTTETRATDNLSLPDSVIETRCEETQMPYFRIKTATIDYALKQFCELMLNNSVKIQNFQYCFFTKT